MYQVALKIRQLHPDAQVPEYKSRGAACFDLHYAGACRPHPTDPNARIFGTGLAFEVPDGYVMKIYSRSGDGFNEATRLSNCVGVIDSDYRGEVMVSLRFDAARVTTISPGSRIAQAMIEIAPKVVFHVSSELSATERGAAGFGSTGN